MKKLLLVASGGGHWTQLLRMQKAFEGHSHIWMTTGEEYAAGLDGKKYVVQDANMWNRLALLKMFFQVAWVLLRVRPDVVVTTGAAPGFAAILFGRLLGAKTIWVDSVANAETLSSSGEHAGKWAHVWLTQWEHLARPEGPYYWGEVL